MNGIKSFLNKLIEQTDNVGQEEVSKNLAKEDTLTLIAGFVKDLKKRFTKGADRLEILNAASKTLNFYINEIESENTGFQGFDMTSSDNDDEDEENYDSEESNNDEESEDFESEDLE